MKRVKVYITGIAGMLGYYLSQAFPENYEISGCDIVDNKHSQLDLTDYKAISKELFRIKPDVIIHTAAMINVGECQRDWPKAYSVNVDITKSLSILAEELGARLIYISTDAVFDGELNRAYSETDNTNALNLYGTTKRLGELYTLNNPNNLVLRTNIYGWNYQDKTSFAEWVYNSLRDGKEINMFIDLYYSPIYVGDFYKIIKQSIMEDLTGLYHCGGGEHCSKYTFAMALSEIFHLSDSTIKMGSFKDMKFFAQRSPNMKLDSGKISERLNINIPGLYGGLKHFKEDRKLFTEAT